MTPNGYQCWICGSGIDHSDEGAVMITVEGLWQWESGVEPEDPRVQSIFAHSDCAKRVLKGATMDLEPHIFGEEESGDDSSTH